MNETAVGKRTFGIGIKISIICGISVLVLLAVGCLVLLNFEYSLSQFFTNEYIQKIELTLAEQGEKQRQLLKNRYKVNAEIAAGIAAPFIYNLDDEGISLALARYMELDEMLAIRVVDEDGNPFFAMWKEPREVRTGNTLPKTAPLARAFSATDASFVHDERVGQVEIYYTDALLSQQFKASSEKARKKIEDFRIIIDQRIDRAFVAQIFSVLCVILVLVASIVASLHGIVLKPMKKCLNLAQCMSEGDFSRKLDAVGQDEIGSLAATLNCMAGNLGQVLAQISQGMEKLAASSAQLHTTAQELSTGSQELSAQAGTAVAATERINDNIYAVTNTAETMSVQSQDMALAAKEMSSDVNSAANSIEKIAASIHEVAQNCSEALIVAEQSRGASSDAEKKMTELDHAAQDIGKVIDLIEGITKKIKLLALNATIEAARSGEAGRGFAVVANEVKNLAQQTALATQDIARQIGSIQSKSSSVVADIQKVANINAQFNDHTSSIAAAVAEQNSTTAEIARIMGGVARNSDRVSDLVAGFSRNIEQEVVFALKEANSEVIRVSGNNRGVNDVAGETARAAGSINAAAKELSMLANEIQQQTGRFKTR